MRSNAQSLRALPDVASAAKTAAPTLPVAHGLQPLFPWGGLRRGSVVLVAGSTSLTLAVVAEASKRGSWCAALGMPELGATAAAERGIELARFPLIPTPGKRWSAVAAALFDGFDLVMIGLDAPVAPSVVRQIEARVRKRGMVAVLSVLTTTVWPHAELVIEPVRASCEGLGNGYGTLTRRRLTVMSRGRGVAGRPRQVEITL